MSYYASFQGRVYLAERDASGNPINTRAVGNVSKLSIALKTDVLEHYESMTGQRSLDLRMIKQKSASVNLTVEEFNRDNLALALYGSAVTSASGSVTGEIIGGTTPKTGERYFLAHPKVASVVLTDSAATPATLTEGTQYTVDADFGAVQFLDLTGLTAPIKAAYTYGALDAVGMFTQPLPERFLRFEGVNTAFGNEKWLIELYRVAFDPLKNLDVVGDDLNKFELDGSLLYDASKQADAALGQFGRLIKLG